MCVCVCIIYAYIHIYMFVQEHMQEDSVISTGIRLNNAVPYSTSLWIQHLK